MNYINVDDHYIKVRNFTKTFGQHINENEYVPVPEAIANLRHKLIKEEYLEVVEAIELNDKVNLVKELCDLLYVVHGYYVTFGLRMTINGISDSKSYNFNECDINTILSDINLAYNNLINNNYSMETLNELLIVTYRSLSKLGVDANDVFGEVHNSNMSKLDKDGKVLYREDGKVMKSDQYFAADVSKFINQKELENV